MKNAREGLENRRVRGLRIRPDTHLSRVSGKRKLAHTRQLNPVQITLGERLCKNKAGFGSPFADFSAAPSCWGRTIRKGQRQHASLGLPLRFEGISGVSR